MQCSTCGFMLPEGATFCTNCGAKIYNQGSGGNQPIGSSQVDPTIPASSTYQTPPANPVAGQQPVPPTVYGAPYSTPQQYSYDAPPPPPPNAYGTPPNTYGTPYPPTPGYGQTPGSYLPGQPPTPPPARKGPRVGLIIGIIVLIIVVVAVGLLALRGNSGNSTSNSVTPTATTASSTSTSTTPTTIPTSVPTSISGTPIDPAAATIVYKAQTSSAIDSNDYPTHLTSNFAVNQNVYVTFQLKTNGQSGYTEAKLYSDTSYVGNKILRIQADYDHGYFTASLNQAATGTVELYWCTTSDCSDAKLATFVTFTVS